jgi:glutaredoxin
MRPGHAAALLLVAALALLMACGCSSCRRRSPEGTAPESTDLPALEVRDDTPDLLLTWIDAKGDFHVVQKPADVPVEGRDAVRVVVTSRDDGTADRFWVSDLRVKGADGTYPVHTMSRGEWEAQAEKRRPRSLALAAPSASSPDAGEAPPPPGTTAPAGKLTAIVYRAEWCGACKEAVRYLRRKGVTVVEKDIEEDPAAKREMQQKLARAGLADRGSIPVIDVRGRIVSGFDPRRLDKAIAEATKGEEL